MYTCECGSVNNFLIHIALADLEVNHMYETSNVNEIDLIFSYIHRVEDIIFPFDFVVCVIDFEFTFKCYFKSEYENLYMWE